MLSEKGSASPKRPVSAPKTTGPAAGTLPPASQNTSSKRVTSIARSIALNIWLRRLAAFVLFDIILLSLFAALFAWQCTSQLPAGTVDTWALTEGQPVTVPAIFSVLPGNELWGKDVLVTMLDGTTASFPLANGLAYAVPVMLVVVALELFSLIRGAFDTRGIRRRLKPLNDLALTAEAIGSAAAVDPTFRVAGAGAGMDGSAEAHDDAPDMDRLENLEAAIASVSVDAPQVSTGDKDLRSIEVALNSLLRRMQEAKLQQMRFVSDASHELRTPIAVIQGYVNMLDRWGKTDPAVLDESIEALKSESAHMQELVEQLLFLARGDSGRNTLQKTTFNLASVASEVREESQMIDDDHIYLLDTQGDPADRRFEMVGDVAMVKQSMRIIVQNAAKYSDAGTTVSIAVRTEGGDVVYSVQDEGCGMSEKDTAHIFERFYRADNARDGRAGGTGLGLAIAKWIVDAHEGTIEVVSREGVGTRFTVRFAGVR